MTRSSKLPSALEHYSLGYQDLFHDRRLFKGFQATLSGILSSGSTRVRQIARAAPQTGCTPHSERRFRRLIHAQPQRADLSLETLEAQKRQAMSRLLVTSPSAGEVGDIRVGVAIMGGVNVELVIVSEKP